jgi:hypothetical protein
LACRIGTAFLSKAVIFKRDQETVINNRPNRFKIEIWLSISRCPPTKTLGKLIGGYVIFPDRILGLEIHIAYSPDEDLPLLQKNSR